MTVYLLGPARYFSIYAQRIIRAGGIPVGLPLVAALPDSRYERFLLLEQADYVFAMPNWRDEKAAMDEFIQAQSLGKVIFRIYAQLEEALSEDVTEEQWILEPSLILEAPLRQETRLM